MISVEGRDPEDAIRDFAWNWLRLLANGELDAAAAMLDSPGDDGRPWTAETLQSAVDDVFHPESIFRREHPEGPRFSSPDTAGELWDSATEIIASDERDWFHYDVPVPINGSWSDVSAIFEFWSQPEGLSVVLESFHVL